MLKADDFGCYTGHRMLLKAAIFPYNPLLPSEAIDQYIAECVAAKLISEYQVDGKIFLYIHKFNQHIRQKRRRFPEPPRSIYSADETQLQCNGSASALQIGEQESFSRLLPTRAESESYLESESESEEEVTNVTLSSLPLDGAKSPKPNLVKMASDVIDWMNWKLDRAWKTKTPKGDPTVICRLVQSRLKAGYTADDCRLVIGHRISKWVDDPKMSQYLTPGTIFRPSNFENYLGECSKLSPKELARIRTANGFVPRSKQNGNGGHNHAE